MVRQISVLDNVYAIITNRDIIILRKADYVKVYESDYFEFLKQESVKND